MAERRTTAGDLAAELAWWIAIGLFGVAFTALFRIVAASDYGAHVPGLQKLATIA